MNSDDMRWLYRYVLAFDTNGTRDSCSQAGIANEMKRRSKKQLLSTANPGKRYRSMKESFYVEYSLQGAGSMSRERTWKRPSRPQTRSAEVKYTCITRPSTERISWTKSWIRASTSSGDMPARSNIRLYA